LLGSAQESASAQARNGRFSGSEAILVYVVYKPVLGRFRFWRVLRAFLRYANSGGLGEYLTALAPRGKIASENRNFFCFVAFKATAHGCVCHTRGISARTMVAFKARPTKSRLAPTTIRKPVAKRLVSALEHSQNAVCRYRAKSIRPISETSLVSTSHSVLKHRETWSLGFGNSSYRKDEKHPRTRKRNFPPRVA
jgi:hypothetical protein